MVCLFKSLFGVAGMEPSGSEIFRVVSSTEPGESAAEVALAVQSCENFPEMEAGSEEEDWAAPMVF